MHDLNMDATTEAIPFIIKTELPSSDCEDDEFTTDTEKLPIIVKIESLAARYDASTENFDRVPLIIKAEPSSSDCEEENTIVETETSKYSSERVTIKPEPPQPPYNQTKRIHFMNIPRPGYNLHEAIKRLERRASSNPEYLPKRNVIKNIESTHWNFIKLLQHCKPDIEDLLTYALMVDKRIEYNLYMNLSFVGRKSFVFNSKFIVLEHSSEIDVTIQVLMELIQLEISRHEELFWFSKEIRIHELIVNTRKLPNRRGGYLKLPMDVCDLQVVMNIQNNDDFCFKWAILYATRNNPYGDAHVKVDITIDRIRYMGRVLDFSSLKFPLEVRECQVFEQNNRHISVNVFGLDRTDDKNTHIYGPLYRTRNEKKLHVNLLYIEDPHQNKSHYAWIHQLRILLRKFGDPPSQYMCNTCLRLFVVECNFLRHKSDKRNCENPLSIYPL